MDVESPVHLERFKYQPEIKLALLRFKLCADADEVRYERAARNPLYWPPVEALAARILGGGRAEEVCEPLTVYGRCCHLLATFVKPVLHAPYAVAIVAADGQSVETLVEVLRRVSYDYWYGSEFFK